MSQKNATVKLVFGGIILLFSTALAFFTANYFKSAEIFNYWSTLVIFTGLYIAVGIVVYKIYAISLGFLFSGDILLLYVLGENFGDIEVWAKFIILVAVVLMLYAITWAMFSEEDQVPVQPPVPSVAPPVAPPMS